MSFQLGFTLLNATQGVNSALSPLFFVKAKKQRGGKGKKINKRERERERGVFTFFFLVLVPSKGKKEIMLLSSHLPFLIFGNREEREKLLFIYIYIYIYIFGRCEKRKKKPFCSSSVVPFLLPLSAFERLPSSSCVHG